MMKQLMDKCDKNAQFIIENRKKQNLYYGKLKDLIDQQKIVSCFFCIIIRLILMIFFRFVFGYK